MNIGDIKKVEILFKELIAILNKYGDSTISNQKRIVEDTIDFIEDNTIEDDKKIIEIEQNYKMLYPAHGGLSEFYIWDNDFEKRKKLNEPLDKVTEELWEIFK
ncbi:hypothetical protein ACJDT4_12915 [Clostridium neuense]|uniref:ABC transporter n=1 Tax=Clostridium neuense TaxID=1728934 RepID=A0ABW8TFT4_9CLOT